MKKIILIRNNEKKLKPGTYIYIPVSVLSNNEKKLKPIMTMTMRTLLVL